MTMIRFLLLALVASTVAANPAVHEYTLDNGLKLIVKEDHRAPVVVSQVWYRVGSSYEHDGLTGISHVLEHMMFKGTDSLGPNEFSEIVAANGGSENAFTSRDYTAYYQQLEKSRLPISFELEADRMRNLKLDPAEFAKEVRVVMEERRLRTEDKPQSKTYERFNAVAFLASPYRIPVIGWMDDLESLEVTDLERWYQKWYAPNNATVVVVGDVDPEAVHALAKEHFGPLPPEEIPTLKPRGEPPQDGTRRVTVKAPAQVPYLLMGYKVPSLVTAEHDWEPYALDVLSYLLDGGDYARLTKNLVRGSQVAASASAGYDPYDRLESLFLLAGVPAPDRTVAELETALRAEVERLRAELVDPAELARVKTQVVAENVFQRDSVFYQAMEIGELETVGLGWRTADEYVDRIRAVTPEQVQAVAKKYLVDDGLTVGILDPQPMQTAQAGGTTAGPDAATLRH